MRLEEHVNLLSQKWRKEYNSRVMKIGLSLGITCPNRLFGGCIFCLPASFTDEINDKKKLTLTEQIEQLLPKIEQNTKVNEFIAYLQDETSTACALDYLDKSLAILENSNIFKEIIISTRPDYLDEEVIKVLKNRDLPITIEIGMQTVHDASLNFLRRNHSQEDTVKALNLCAKHNIPVGVHLILGIPGETEAMVLQTINFVNETEIIKDVKIHNLVVYQGTQLAKIYQELQLLTYQDYIKLLGVVIGNLDANKTISRLFTSNLRRDFVAINPFPGLKKTWLRDLWLYLKTNSISQGIYREKD
ncbi:MAG: radical SAM protein [Candidatus Cloacimonadales bacterium]